MALNPQDKSQLFQFTVIAKKIIFDKQRMKQFIQMLGSKDGALVAVQTVMGVIDKKSKIPTNLSPLLGVNVYMMMVDIAQKVTGHKADTGIMQDVIAKIMATVFRSHGKQQAAPAAPQPAQPPSPPAGIIGQQMQGAM